MTVQELINKLSRVKNKNADIWIHVEDESGNEITSDQLNCVYEDNGDVWLDEFVYTEAVCKKYNYNML